MKSSVALFLFALLVLVATTGARPHHGESDLMTFDEERYLEHTLAQNGDHIRKQRRRHSRQAFDRYDNFSPSYDIMRLLRIINEDLAELREISVNQRPPAVAPAPAAQIIFYPVYYNPNAPSETPCKHNTNLPTLDNRRADDSNNNVNKLDEDDDDAGRPISFIPINTNNPQGRPSPPVEHGSVQAGLSTETTTTAKPTDTRKLPGVCESAIIMCCRFPKDSHKNCFNQFGCSKTFSTGVACSPKAIQLVIQHFKDAYAPK